MLIAFPFLSYLLLSNSKSYLLLLHNDSSPVCFKQACDLSLFSIINLSMCPCNLNKEEQRLFAFSPTYSTLFCQHVILL